MELKYRVLEVQGLFHIQVYDEYKVLDKVTWFNKSYKDDWGWFMANKFGRKAEKSLMLPSSAWAMTPFQTLEAAKAQINKWQMPTKIHEI